MDRTSTSTLPPTLIPAHSTFTTPPHQRLVNKGSDADRGRSADRKLGTFGDRQRSSSRNYDIFLPKSSHIHTPQRIDTCQNPDKITRLASPTRTLHPTDGGQQNYRTSLSAVSHSRDELNSRSSDDLDSSSDALSCHSDSPFRKRLDNVTYMSLPAGAKSSERFRALDAKTSKILREYHAERNKFRLELYDISTGVDRSRIFARSEENTPTAELNGHVPTPDTPRASTPNQSFASRHGAVTPTTPVIKITTDVNGNGEGNPNKMEQNGGFQTGGKPLITAEYYCVKRVNYDELKQRFDGEPGQATDDAVKKLNLLSANGEKEMQKSPSKRSLANSISNFFRKMSPRLHRKSRSEKSSNSSMMDDDDMSQGSGPSSPAHKTKSPISSPLRKLMNGKKALKESTSSPMPTVAPSDDQNNVIRVTITDSPQRSRPPQTLDVAQPLVKAGANGSAKRGGLLSALSTDSIGDCSLDVNMTGSDPSIASAHQQSCSISKRTLHSSEPAQTKTQPSSYSHPEIHALANGNTQSDVMAPDGKPASYVGLSVSVSGYPKYRQFKNEKCHSVRESEDRDINSSKMNTSTNNVDDDVFLPGEKRTSANITTNGHSIPSSVTIDEGKKSESESESKKVPNTSDKEWESVAIVTESGDGPKDGRYFIQATDTEAAKLLSLVKVAEEDLSKGGKSEEVCGKLRAAVGKANLLVTRKFKQFKGLCDSNLHPTSTERKLITTSEDLAGFWDMVSLQVEDVYISFKEIQQMRDNGWKVVSTPPVYHRSLSSSSQKATTENHSIPTDTPKGAAKRPVKKAQTTPKSKSKAQADKSREEARKRLMEAKRLARRKRLTSGGSADDVEIFVPEDKHA